MRSKAFVSITRRHSSASSSTSGLRNWSGIVDEDFDLDTRGIEPPEGGNDGGVIGHVERLAQNGVSL